MFHSLIFCCFKLFFLNIKNFGANYPNVICYVTSNVYGVWSDVPTRFASILYCLVGSWTRKHSIRMRTASHEMSALVGDRQVNRFEQVSNLSHQMTLVEGMGPCTEGAVCSEVQCIMDNGNMDTPMDRMMYRHDWKHYLPATSLVGSNNRLCKMKRLSNIVAGRKNQS